MDLVQAAKIIGYDYIPAPEQIRELIIRAAARVAELEAQLEAVNNRLKIATDYWVIEAQNVKYCEGRIQELEAALAAAQERERWIPASEAPPKNGPYLILFKGKVIYATFLTNGWYQGYYANSVVPDAWRELPAPPEEAADAE